MVYKIAIIVGSLRKDSINRKVARSICAIRGDNRDCSMTASPGGIGGFGSNHQFRQAAVYL